MERCLPVPRLRRAANLFSISKRHHCFVVHEKDVTVDMRACDDGVVFMLTPQGDKENKPIPGIRGIYQLKVQIETSTSRLLSYRECACWCRYCVVGDYANCVVSSRWINIDLSSTRNNKDVASTPRRCSRCGEPGHNIKSCKVVVPLPPDDQSHLQDFDLAVEDTLN